MFSATKGISGAAASTAQEHHHPQANYAPMVGIGAPSLGRSSLEWVCASSGGLRPSDGQPISCHAGVGAFQRCFHPVDAHFSASYYYPREEVLRRFCVLFSGGLISAVVAQVSRAHRPGSGRAILLDGKIVGRPLAGGERRSGPSSLSHRNRFYPADTPEAARTAETSSIMCFGRGSGSSSAPPARFPRFPGLPVLPAPFPLSLLPLPPCLPSPLPVPPSPLPPFPPSSLFPPAPHPLVAGASTGSYTSHTRY